MLDFINKIASIVLKLTIAGILLVLFFGNQANAMEQKDFDCLALNAHMEARGEGIDGMIAVSEVVLNRVEDRRWPDNVCDVVYQKWQFSWTMMSEGYIAKGKADGDFSKAVEAAKKSLYDYDRTNGANHYYSTIIELPSWAKKMEKTYEYKKHIFYKG